MVFGKFGIFWSMILENFVLQNLWKLGLLEIPSTTFELPWNENCVKASMNARVWVWMQQVISGSLGVTPT